jgi:phenylalanyl-tRNA synthetase beta chain
MRVPLEWLKEYVAVEAPAEEVATRLTMGGLEVEGIEESALGPVLDVYVTPNRGDCLSMVGVAREVAALFSLQLHIPSPPPSSDGGETAEQTSVAIEDMTLCPRYAARLVRGLRIGPSPEWMQARLEAAGQRPINNVVDVTNYVMLEMGQPLHAFDLDKLRGGRIIVRPARAGERLTTLDGIERTLAPSMLVIADASKPVALAGIMGGFDSEVSDSTKNLLLESAHFNPLSIRRTSRALGLRTEASYRFERVVDPDGVRRAVDRACDLLAAMGQNRAVEGVADVTVKFPLRELSLRISRVHDLLGTEVPSHVAADCLRALGFEVRTDPHGATDTLQVHVPTFRSDIAQEEDLIEEIGRIHGYANIPETLPFGNTTQGGDSPFGLFLMRVRNSLVACGLQEVVTHSLTAPSFFDAPDDAARRVAVRNALSAELSGLRRSLLPTLLDVAKSNSTRGTHDLALFEAGRVWQKDPGAERPAEYVAIAGLLCGAMTEKSWHREPKPLIADFGAARGVVERMLEDLRIRGAVFEPLGERGPTLPQFHPGRSAVVTLNGEIIGVVGEAHPRLSQGTGLRERVYLFELSGEALEAASRAESPQYQPLSVYPAVVRDLAPRVAEELPFSAVEAAVHGASPEILESYRLTDVYRGAPLPEGVKSLTLSFTFRSPDRTLAEGEINEALERLRSDLATGCSATFP